MSAINLRPELSHHLNQRLSAFREGFRQNLSIIGPPGSGKTFQFQQFIEHYQQELPVVFCPLYRESCRSFLQRFAISILQAGLTFRQLPAGSGTQPLGALLAQAQPLLPKTAAALEPIENLLSRRLYAEAFNRILDAVAVLFAECGSMGVLILDEFLLLEDMGLGHTFHELGKRVMTSPSTWFVLASSSPYRARVILRERLQLLFGQFELVTLGALDTATASTWVEQSLSHFEDRHRVSDFLLHWLEGYPWYLSVWLKRLREVALLRGSHEVTEELSALVAWDLLGHAEGALNQWCASRLGGISQTRQGGRVIEVLIHLAGGVRTATELGKRLGRAGLAAALQELVEKDLVQRNGTCWMVSDPVLRCWLSTVLRRQHLGLAASEPQGRLEMSLYLQQLWLRWDATQQLPLWEQMSHLFRKFSDDTVCLDAKTGKLPSFSAVRQVNPPEAQSGRYLVAESEGKRWVAAIQEQTVDERAIASFDVFCRSQIPKPTRKILITQSPLDEHARVIAKTANMWVWQAEELELLTKLYDQEP